MSTNTIRCPKCLTPLADKRPVGHIKLRKGVFVQRLLPAGGDVVCPVCGNVKRVTYPGHPEPERLAA